MKALALALATVALLAGCGPKFKAKTKGYYLQHLDEMKAVLKDCSNRGIVPMGESEEARNCAAAMNAERERFFR